MATKKTKTRGRRAAREPLSVERVVAAAIAIADAHGTAALTMRAVADALGVQAMSLYNHVANKDALLDRMVDAVFARVEVPLDADWRTAMAARARAIHAASREHPWAVGLLESRRSPGATTLMHHDATIGVLRRAGFSAAMVAHALAVLDAYVYGFALQELSLPLGPNEDVPALAAEILASMPADALPHLAWFTAEHVMAPGYSFSDELEYGLELVLDGLARRVEGERSPRAKGARR
ncbi:MAG: TetR/AcrR family transcriptional regulator C-terminal domain-containing protein [Sandaracinaceae bacterium]|nr:TetR/AcrR family transcriptional regulator C-terminal domain-containing protein [Sandaracinaceae bacterium]